MNKKEYIENNGSVEFIELDDNEKLFLNKMEWYNRNLPISESIKACTNELKLNKNIKKRNKFISIMKSVKDSSIGTKKFFDETYKIYGI